MRAFYLLPHNLNARITYFYLDIGFLPTKYTIDSLLENLPQR